MIGVLSTALIGADVTAAGAADAAPSGCPTGYVCGWSARDYKGSMWWTAPVPSGQCVKVGHTNSIFNNANGIRYARIWNFADGAAGGGYWCSGANMILAPGKGIRNLGFDGSGLGGL
ncbi:peptidase inhibitor family I36 protein [Nonomuraea sp. B5E05]|uniref:peptidase inhibitor family I36 protein n=1 Tax=Nonomuraea sp. B5E05 TaxID=3153569 RepID=UPI0032619E4E